MIHTRVISIVSGKGGVGKTTLSINLAYTLANVFKKKVLLIDANITTSHLGLSLGLTAPKITLNKLLKSRSFTFQPERYKNVDLILSGMSPRELIGVNIRKLPSLVKKIERRKEYDFILLDSAPGLGREALAAIKASNEILFITNPLTPAALDIIRVSEISSSLKIPSLGLVLNMVRRKPYELTAYEIERFTNVPVVAEIPFDRKILTALALKKPVAEVFPESRTSKEIKRLCSVITGEPLENTACESVSVIEKLKRYFGSLFKH